MSTTASLPLPPDHWLYKPAGAAPKPLIGNDQRNAIAVAIKWAVQAATMSGSEPDYDPDALVQNATYALCGPVMTATQKRQLDEPDTGA